MRTPDSFARRAGDARDSIAREAARTPGGYICGRSQPAPQEGARRSKTRHRASIDWDKAERLEPQERRARASRLDMRKPTCGLARGGRVDGDAWGMESRQKGGVAEGAR